MAKMNWSRAQASSHMARVGSESIGGYADRRGARAEVAAMGRKIRAAHGKAGRHLAVRCLSCGHRGNAFSRAREPRFRCTSCGSTLVRWRA